VKLLLASVIRKVGNPRRPGALAHHGLISPQDRSRGSMPEGQLNWTMVLKRCPRTLQRVQSSHGIDAPGLHHAAARGPRVPDRGWRRTLQPKRLITKSKVASQMAGLRRLLAGVSVEPFGTWRRTANAHHIRRDVDAGWVDRSLRVPRRPCAYTYPRPRRHIEQWHPRNVECFVEGERPCSIARESVVSLRHPGSCSRAFRPSIRLRLCSRVRLPPVCLYFVMRRERG